MIFGTPLDSYLDPGESLLWSGQPKQGVRVQASDVVMIPFSLLWGCFAFFWEGSVLGLTPATSHQRIPIHSAATLFMAVWGIPFCLIGIYIIFGRFFVDAAARKRTWYGVTNRRVIVLKTLFKTSVVSFDLVNLAGLNLNERKDNSGDILFGQPGPYGTFADSGWRQGRGYVAPGFYLLPDARQIYNRIREAQQKARS